MQAVVSQQQLVVAHERVRDTARAEPGAQQARASLEVGDCDEPPARGETGGQLFSRLLSASDGRSDPV